MKNIQDIAFHNTQDTQPNFIEKQLKNSALLKSIGAHLKALRNLFKFSIANIGKAGELLIRTYLKLNLYIIVEKNYKCKDGEIDIIAFKNKTLIFVEVKTRIIENRTYPTLQSINEAKQKRIIRSAIYFMSKKTNKLKKFKVRNIRFDAITLSFKEENNTFLKPVLSHYKDFFCLN